MPSALLPVDARINWTDVGTNTIVVLLNILIFVCVQTVFFWKIASKQLEDVVRKNARVLTETRKQLRRTPHMDPVVQLVDSLVVDLGTKDGGKESVRAAEAAAEQRNRQLLMRMVLPWIVVIVALIVLLSLWNLWKGVPFTVVHRFGVFLVLFAYFTEILLFLYVIEPWVHVGRFEMLGILTGAGCGGVRQGAF